ncbi:MAG: shikimate dehydrogenase [Clostridiales bacterium]|nr:shikimate dehydrogenase [Clostridiales bacterium]
MIANRAGALPAKLLDGQGLISASTKLYAVLGDPVGHSLSPLIHNCFAKALGHDLVYTAFRVSPYNLEAAIKGAWGLGVAGFNITVPHKRNVMPMCARIDKQARTIGAVNTLKYADDGYVGYNTDWIGIISTLRDAGHDMRGKSVMILGAGGSAYAACVAACESGASRVTVANRTMSHAERLREHILCSYSTSIDLVELRNANDVSHKEVVIQTTTAGFGVQASLCPVASRDFFSGVSVALDLIYSPWETVFLKWAAQSGVCAINGFPDLVWQAAASYEIWNGEINDRNYIKKAIINVSETINSEGGLPNV